MNLGTQTERFILHFGEMGSRWGVNRTVGQIYALLFLSPRALHADEIAQTLGFARSNVSTGLRELQSWRLVRMTHQMGDRREYFDTPEDVWEIFRILCEEKCRREIDPTLTMLRNVLLEKPTSEDDGYSQHRIAQMLELMELATSWFNEINQLPPETLKTLMRMGAKIQKALSIVNRLRGRTPTEDEFPAEDFAAPPENSP
ncbi:GbsR/MarR family transcriptional regulator [Castellaniella caeni]|uniref:GbsR/MarR family transcriptional regulator n=1 Tax=Castellaniella caeni TaxID=266123 RepID=UPI000AC436E2|nr:GbsR/MarR family transcriptional regulator [Castellaniella caeni]